MIGAPYLFAETITRKARNAMDTDQTIPGCSIQQGVSTEPAEQGRPHLVITEMVVFVPPQHADQLTSEDRLILRGQEYSIEGQPTPETSVLTGSRAMTPVAVRRAQG